jgi:hypothetical protein
MKELEANLTTGSNLIRKGKQGDRPSEMIYALAYQALVRAGVRPQLRAKYRP